MDEFLGFFHGFEEHFEGLAAILKDGYRIAQFGRDIGTAIDEAVESFFPDIVIKMGPEFLLGGDFWVGVLVSLLKLFGVEEFELSPIHSKKIVEHGSQNGQGNDGQCPANGSRRPSSMVDDGSDGPNGGQNI